MTDESGKARVRQWLCRDALPLWLPADRGGFVEYLTPEGLPDDGALRRVMVQARQLYVYSHAALLGLMPDAAAAAQNGFDFLLSFGAPDGVARGFVHALDSKGRVLEETRDLYDHAFLLLGLSWFYRLSREKRVAQAVEDIMVAITALRHGSGLGYRENDKGTLPRRQNPHMHLLEAFLAAHAAGLDGMIERAGEIVDLFKSHFFDGAVLLEYFDDALTPGPPVIEPGHHLEWVWLLNLYSRATGQDMDTLTHALYASALRHGTEPHTGLLYNEIWRDGSLKDAAKRLWPQTERLKVESVLSVREGPVSVDRIFRHFLDPAPAGAWTDRLDVANSPLKGNIPASSLYHLFLAFTEYLSR